MNDQERDALLIEMHTDLKNIREAELPKRVGRLEQKISAIMVWSGLAAVAAGAAVVKFVTGGDK